MCSNKMFQLMESNIFFVSIKVTIYFSLYLFFYNVEEFAEASNLINCTFLFHITHL